MQRPEAREIAKGRWRGILVTLGVSDKDLTGNHGPCPICGGKDRFRFDDKDGRGTWYCNHCGAGDGFSLLMKLRGTDFAETAKDVLAAAGSSPVENRSKKHYTDEQRRLALRQLWQASEAIKAGDPVETYLRARKIDLHDYPVDLRTVRECPVTGVQGVRKLPAMIALVRDPNGDPVTLHRTYLGAGKKADIDAPRRLMPGAIPKGSAIRLFHCEEGRLGIAEGIETALAAALMFDMPVWAAVNATLLAKFEPPPGITELTIYADNDPNFAGHAAAYSLAHSLAGKCDIDVCPPQQIGADWADILKAQKEAA